jgi:hypothetical protein
MPPTRVRRVKLDQLDLPRTNMSGMCARFSEEEVWAVVKADGFLVCFLHVAWPIIRHDLMLDFDSFWRLDSRNLHSVNKALLTLLPKSEEASGVKDYRLISLIHIVGKLLSKVLANWLAPKLPALVHISRSAFVKGRFIQYNFKLV